MYFIFIQCFITKFITRFNSKGILNVIILKFTQFKVINILRYTKMKMDNFEKIMKNNKEWSKKNLEEDPQYFKKHLQSQSPNYLFIGCSDSRIPAETVLGLKPGQVFVHRNIANQVSLADINTLSVIQYAVQVLQVTDIIVVGHYGCGGIKAAFKKQDHGALQAWLAHVRDIRIRFRDLLVKEQQQNEDLLVELNVKSQVYDIAKIPVVQKAWIEGRQLRIHGLVYQLQNGILKDLGLTLSKLQMIPEQYWIYQNKPIQIIPKRIFRKSCDVSIDFIPRSENKNTETQ